MIASPATAPAPAARAQRPPSILSNRHAVKSPALGRPGRGPASVACGAAKASLLDRLATLFAPSSSPASSSKPADALRPTPAATAAAKRIVELAEATNRGTQVTPETRDELLTLAAKLCDDEAPLTKGSRQAAKNAITGTWRQLFSTEKETLFIFTTIAPLFGVKGEEAYQVIDADGGRLQNVITFSNGARFVVESTLSVDDDDEDEQEEEGSPLPLRCYFKFTGAALKLPSGRAINLPPAGQGWFDTTFVSDEARVAFDVRKDTLVVEREGPPRWF
jgi:hypothetical protein